MNLCNTTPNKSHTETVEKKVVKQFQNEALHFLFLSDKKFQLMKYADDIYPYQDDDT